MNGTFFAPCNRRPTKDLINTTHVSLKHIVSTCSFVDESVEKKSQIILHCKSSRFRRQALRKLTQTLKELGDHGRALETSESYAQGIETAGKYETTNTTDKLEYKPKHQSTNRRSTPQREANSYYNNDYTCYNRPF